MEPFHSKKKKNNSHDALSEHLDYLEKKRKNKRSGDNQRIIRIKIDPETN